MGARFDDRVTGKVDAFAPHAEIIHIDIDPSSISKNIKVGRADRRRLPRVLARWSRPSARRRPRWRRSARRGSSGSRRSPSGRQKHPLPLRLGRRRDQAAVRGRGDLEPHQAARRSSSPASASTRCGRPSTTASATRGTGSRRAGWAPWATGCRPPWACRSPHPASLVINIDGDGSFLMNSQELATCFTENLPVKTVIINNGGHGMVRQWQRHHLQGALPRDRPLRRSRLREAGRGLRLRRAPRHEAERGGAGAREDAEHAGPVIVDVMVDKDECVFPMVPAGGANTDMILAPAESKDVRGRPPSRRRASR